MLLVTLAPSTGNQQSSFAEITVAVFSNASAAVPSGSAITVTDNGSSLGSTKLTAVNGSSFVSTFAGTFCGGVELYVYAALDQGGDGIL